MTNIRTLSHWHGRIQEIIVSLPGTKERPVLTRDAIKRIQPWLDAFGEGVRIYLLGFFSERETERIPENVTLIPADLGVSKGPESKWIQDAFLVQENDAGQKWLLEPLHKKNGLDQLAEQISARMDFLLKPTRFQFAGGNIIPDSEITFAGADILKNAATCYPKIPEKLRKVRFEKEFRELLGVREIEWIGWEFAPQSEKLPGWSTPEQPVYHLDLFLTNIGKTPEGQPSVLIGDPGPQWFLGDPGAEKAPIAEIREGINRIANRLKQQGIHIVRIPLPIRFSNQQSFPLSFNNALFQYHLGRKKIWLPDFAKTATPESAAAFLKQIQNHTQTLLENENIQVIWVKGDFFQEANNYGSLHCMTKVLSRTTK